MRRLILALALIAGCSGGTVTMLPPPVDCRCDEKPCACAHCKTPAGPDGSRPRCACKDMEKPG